MCVKNILVNGMMGIKGLRKISVIFLFVLCLIDFGKFYAFGFEDNMSDDLQKKVEIFNLEKTMSGNSYQLENIEKCEGFFIYEVSNVRDVEVEFTNMSGITWCQKEKKYVFGLSGEDTTKDSRIKYLPQNGKFGKFQNNLYINVASDTWCQIYCDGEDLSFNKMSKNEINEFKKRTSDSV